MKNQILKGLKKFGKILCVILFFIGFFDLLGIINFSYIKGSFSFLSFVILIEFLLSYIDKGKENKTLHFFKKFIVIVTFLELTLFQLPSYVVLFRNYEEKIIFPSDMAVENHNLDKDNKVIFISGNNENILILNNLDYPISTLKFNIKFITGSGQVKTKIDVADSTRMYPIESISETTIIKDTKNSEYIFCNFFGDVSQLKIKLTNFDNDDHIQIESIVLNEKIPFDISITRFVLLNLFGLLIYSISYSKILRKSYINNKKICNLLVSIITIIMIALSLLITILKTPDYVSKSMFNKTWGDQITQEIVDAFENNQSHLLIKPSQGLINLDNPYDYSLRQFNTIDYRWDHVYYEGKYYSYYGIAPVLTLFLPYHIITGYYFPTEIAIFMFTAIGIIFLALTFLAIIKRWFNEIPTGCVIAGIIILFSSCGIWFSVGNPRFYEIATSSGFMFLVIGAYFMISSNLLSKEKISLPRVALSSLFIGLSVLSRPTLAMYAVCAVIFYLFGISKSSNVYDKVGNIIKKNKIYQLKYILCAFIPLLYLAMLQMWYNYDRFGSIFDFGIQYSLTINDFVHNEFHLIFAIIGLYNFLFAMPMISCYYPYITTPFSYFDVNGYYYLDGYNTSGILFLAFPVIGYLFSHKAIRKITTKKDKFKYVAMIGLPCILMPIIIISSYWESGYSLRYMADFSWQIVIGALSILFFLYIKSKNVTKKNMFLIFMAISTVAAIIINGVQIFNFIFRTYEHPIICKLFENIVSFWK